MTTKIKAENIDLSADNLVIGGTSSDPLSAFSGTAATTFVVNKQSNSHNAAIQLDAGNSAGAYLQLGTAGTKTLELKSVINVNGYDNKLTAVTNNSLIFGTNNTDRMYITGDGKVGINQASPSAALHITGSGDTKIIIEDGSDEQSIVGHSGGLNYNVVSGDKHTFTVNSADVAAVNANGIGIGTFNPNEKLEISGGNFGFNLGTGSLGNRYILVNSGTGNDGGFVFKRANTNRWQQTIASGDDDNMWFYSYGTNNSVLTLDRSSGAVNMQNQPVAVYTHSANSEVGAYAYQWPSTGANTATMKPQSAVVNRGSMYNTSNGRWTAPVAGIYRYAIHGNLYTYGIANNAYFTLRILKNGSTHVLYHYEDNSINNAGGWNYKNYAGIVELAAGDYIEMQLITNNLTDASRQNFGWDTSNYTHYEFHLLY